MTSYDLEPWQALKPALDALVLFKRTWPYNLLGLCSKPALAFSPALVGIVKKSLHGVGSDSCALVDASTNACARAHKQPLAVYKIFCWSCHGGRTNSKMRQNTNMKKI